TLQKPMEQVPEALARWPLELSQTGQQLTYSFDTQQEDTGIAALLRALAELGIDFKDLHSSESSLEDIFVSLVHDTKAPA
ncbi:MAG: multidrug ABC transporter ATP-binding protein, partial [Giesbergeria sp.]